MSGRTDRPIRLADDPRLLTRADCEAIARRLGQLTRAGGDTDVAITSLWTGAARWARNQVSLASDRRSLSVSVRRNVRGLLGSATTNQVDDASLEGAVRAAEWAASFGPPQPKDFDVPPPAFTYPHTTAWSEATYGLTADTRGQVVQALGAAAEAHGMLSAGYLEARAQAVAALRCRDAHVESLYATCTQAECSMTVRDTRGTGSGWAGLSSYDWAKLDAAALGQRALEKCVASRHPVSLEPGRYTVILEPQAVHDLVSLLVQSFTFRSWAEGPPFQGPWALGPDPALGLGRSKLGLKVVDERVTISHDPTDPALGVLPFQGWTEPYQPVTWIDHGVLTALNDNRRGYALGTRAENLAVVDSGAFRMSGGPTSLEAMIQSTARGLLVTRFSNVHVLDERSLLATGLTRDGLWLIEHGKITKAVKNFRFTESPLFVLNNLEQLGEPVPVFRPVQLFLLGRIGRGVTPAIVPPVKARDFSFTSTIDAI
jgi:predicted Zn-dependent protease